ncbi:hypothetical protein Q9966_011825 [Columba livia]|nr:hypothetical protein Q9966_011825 [Columba livia]
MCEGRSQVGLVSSGGGFISAALGLGFDYGLCLVAMAEDGIVHREPGKRILLSYLTGSTHGSSKRLENASADGWIVSSCTLVRNVNHGNVCATGVSAKPMQIHVINEGNVDRRLSVVTPSHLHDQRLAVDQLMALFLRLQFSRVVEESSLILDKTTPFPFSGIHEHDLKRNRILLLTVCLFFNKPQENLMTLKFLMLTVYEAGHVWLDEIIALLMCLENIRNNSAVSVLSLRQSRRVPKMWLLDYSLLYGVLHSISLAIAVGFCQQIPDISLEAHEMMPSPVRRFSLVTRLRGAPESTNLSASVATPKNVKKLKCFIMIIIIQYHILLNFTKLQADAYEQVTEGNGHGICCGDEVPSTPGHVCNLNDSTSSSWNKTARRAVVKFIVAKIRNDTQRTKLGVEDSWVFTQALVGMVKVMNQAVRLVRGPSPAPFQLRVLAFE